MALAEWLVNNSRHCVRVYTTGDCAVVKHLLKLSPLITWKAVNVSIQFVPLGKWLERLLK